MAEQIKKTLEKYINDFPSVIDPCELCKNKINGRFQIECKDCCYYYASNFEAKDTDELVE